MIRGGNNESQDSNKRPREDGKSNTEKPEKRAKLADSSGFMNALNASAPEKPSKKKKRSNSKDQKVLFIQTFTKLSDMGWRKCSTLLSTALLSP